jgi:sterol desaturase/sphingolipid hydroxylase (fatty acid hydroxylase superfamily)
MNFEKYIPLQHFVNFEKRIAYPYLISSLLIVVIFYIIKKKSFNPFAFIRYYFNPKVLFHSSSRTDLFFFLFNHLFLICLIVPFVLSQIQIIKYINETLKSLFPHFQQWQINPFANSLLFTIIYFILSDFSRFLLHFTLHKTPFLWEFHKVHHSATVLTPLTVYRVHPIEALLYFIRSLLVVGFVAGAFAFLFRGQIIFTTILGIQVFELLFNIFGSNLRHSHVPISFGKTLETFFVSPVMHQTHHSISKNKNSKNLGSTFTFWDILFKTYRRPDFKLIRFGLSKNQRIK